MQSETSRINLTIGLSGILGKADSTVQFEYVQNDRYNNPRNSQIPTDTDPEDALPSRCVCWRVLYEPFHGASVRVFFSFRMPILFSVWVDHHSTFLR